MESKMDKPHKNLNAWKLGMDIVQKIYSVTENFPAEEKFGLISQIRKSSVSIPSNIAEGAGRNTKKEFVHFLHISQGSLSELDTQFELALRLQYIDEFNVLKASLEAMRRAVLALASQPEFLLVDGIHKVPIAVPQQCLKKGDQICRSISAASVVAKVYRDRIMQAYSKMYPVYGFEKNKGYGTKQHLAALRQYGPSPLHRITFKGVY